MLGLARIIVPVVLPFATFAAGVKFGAFESYVTSPLSVTFALALVLFPAGASFILAGIKYRMQEQASRTWPTVTGHVIPNKKRAFYYTGGPWVDFWYVVNGRRYEQTSIQLAHWRRSSTPYGPGKEIELRFDPEQPETAVVVGGDDADKYFVRAGIIALVAPLILGWPLAAMAQ